MCRYIFINVHYTLLFLIICYKASTMHATFHILFNIFSFSSTKIYISVRKRWSTARAEVQTSWTVMDYAFAWWKEEIIAGGAAKILRRRAVVLVVVVHEWQCGDGEPSVLLLIEFPRWNFIFPPHASRTALSPRDDVSRRVIPPRCFFLSSRSYSRIPFASAHACVYMSGCAWSISFYLPIDSHLLFEPFGSSYLCRLSVLNAPLFALIVCLCWTFSLHLPPSFYSLFIPAIVIFFYSVFTGV